MANPKQPPRNAQRTIGADKPKARRNGDDAAPLTADEVRSGSRTAQDRKHTIQGGDDRTAPMKEFPT